MTERRSTELTHFVNAELVVISSHRVVDVALRRGCVGHGDGNFRGCLYPSYMYDTKMLAMVILTQTSRNDNWHIISQLFLDHEISERASTTSVESERDIQEKGGRRVNKQPVT